MKRKKGREDSAPHKRQRQLANYQQQHQHQPQSLTPSSQVNDSVLDLYYRHVCTLGDFIRDCLPSTSRTRRKRLSQFDQDFPSHAGFLNEIVIGTVQQPSSDLQRTRQEELVVFTQTQRAARGDSREHQACDLGEIVDFAIWLLFRRNIATTRGPSHVLCHGYQRTGSLRNTHEHDHDICLPGIVQRIPNANVEWMKQPPWTHVANLLGHDAERIMLHLLFDCGVFQKLNSGHKNLYQMSGEPISQLTFHEGAQIAKTKQSQGDQPADMVKRPSSIVFARNRMLYARPAINNQGQVQLGLKHIHVLNRLNNLDDMVQDIRVMQYIFPRQFGLHNVFTSKPDLNESKQVPRDYTLRERETGSLSDNVSIKIPRRLRGEPCLLVRQLRRNHRQCSYTQLLRHYCPINQSNATLSCETSQESESLSMSAEQTATQIQRTSMEMLDHKSSEPCQTTSLIPYSTPIAYVTAFCQAVIKRLLPQQTFGVGKDGQHNLKLVLLNIDQFVNRQRFESMTLHETSTGQRFKCIGWIRPPSSHEDERVSASDRTKRLDLLYELIYYVFDSILIPIIRSNFYVTETGVYRNRLFYFRHDVWKRLVDPSLSMMRLSMFEPLNAAQLRHHCITNTLGCSQMRLLPKQHGIRPIMNLKRKTSKFINGKVVSEASINTRLGPVFSVLNFERCRHPETLASAMFSANEIATRLRNFKTSLCAGRKDFYFVKVDIRSCFDTIPQQELLAFVNSLLHETEYKIARHVEVKRLAGTGDQASIRSVSRHALRAMSADEYSLLTPSTAAHLASKKSRHVFAGFDQERVIKIEQIRKFLADHLLGNIVRIGRKHFRQVTGIPQGSILSSLLCSLFYSEFEHQMLHFLKPQDSLLLRLIDDFLLITTDAEQARCFVQAMSQENVKYGISVNAEKSLVNFEISIAGHQIPRLHGVDGFPYCGMTINTRTLQLRKDRHVKDVHVGNGISVARSGSIGRVFRNKILASFKRQMHVVFVDGRLDAEAQVLHSLFECLIEIAMKMHCYLKALPAGKRPSQGFLIEVCKQLIHLGHLKVQRHWLQYSAATTRQQINWLAAIAISRVLVRKQSDYTQLLSWLTHTERATRKYMNMSEQETGQLIVGGMKMFVDYVY